MRTAPCAFYRQTAGHCNVTVNQLALKRASCRGVQGLSAAEGWASGIRDKQTRDSKTRGRARPTLLEKPCNAQTLGADDPVPWDSGCKNVRSQLAEPQGTGGVGGAARGGRAEGSSVCGAFMGSHRSCDRAGR